jgi:hypothetical protein
MEFNLSVDEWLGLIEVQDLPKLVKVMEEAMSSDSTADSKKKIKAIP